MNQLVVTDHIIPKMGHQIRHFRHQLAQLSNLLCAIELDIQHGQMRNLQVLLQRAQQLCEQLSKDFAPPLDWLEARQNPFKGTGGLPASRPDNTLEPSLTFSEHIGWLIALTNALRSNVEPDCPLAKPMDVRQRGYDQS